jgi:hypothetical protein
MFSSFMETCIPKLHEAQDQPDELSGQVNSTRP